MGIIIDFPVERRLSAGSGDSGAEHAGRVIILPVIRVERSSQDSDGVRSGTRNDRSGGKRRRRASRS